MFAVMADLAWFRGANFNSANLAHGYYFNFSFAGATMRDTDLTGASLFLADLRGADLRGAILLGANLMQADLRGAVLYGANLAGAKLDYADVKKVSLLPPPPGFIETKKKRFAKLYANSYAHPSIEKQYTDYLEQLASIDNQSPNKTTNNQEATPVSLLPNIIGKPKTVHCLWGRSYVMTESKKLPIQNQDLCEKKYSKFQVRLFCQDTATAWGLVARLNNSHGINGMGFAITFQDNNIVVLPNGGFDTAFSGPDYPATSKKIYSAPPFTKHSRNHGIKKQKIPLWDSPWW
ncbi:MAG: pentapeptide repeat-containing protein [Magnetococcales bacterium]|nr:pentapeptide repeat-containing protein [Magnetococcales bacterium]